MGRRKEGGNEPPCDARPERGEGYFILAVTVFGWFDPFFRCFRLLVDDGSRG